MCTIGRVAVVLYVVCKSIDVLIFEWILWHVLTCVHVQLSITFISISLSNSLCPTRRGQTSTFADERHWTKCKCAYFFSPSNRSSSDGWMSTVKCECRRIECATLCSPKMSSHSTLSFHVIVVSLLSVFFCSHIRIRLRCSWSEKCIYWTADNSQRRCSIRNVDCVDLHTNEIRDENICQHCSTHPTTTQMNENNAHGTLHYTRKCTQES